MQREAPLPPSGGRHDARTVASTSRAPKSPPMGTAAPREVSETRRKPRGPVCKRTGAVEIEPEAIPASAPARSGERRPSPRYPDAQRGTVMANRPNPS